VSGDPKESSIERIGVCESKEILPLGIAIRDIPMSSEPSIVEDACQEIQRSRASENRSFRAQRNLVIRNRDPRFTDKIRTVHWVEHVSTDPEESEDRESRGLAHRDTERRETPTGLKAVIL
jgi:hypothetical protein